jgi:hypothetical protein
LFNKWRIICPIERNALPAVARVLTVSAPRVSQYPSSPFLVKLVMEKNMSDRKLPEGLVVYDREPVEVANPFSGEKVLLQPDAVAVYDGAKGAEALKDYDFMNECLTWFRVNEPSAYMKLLD